MSGWRRVSVHVAMTQMAHPTAGKVQADDDRDDDESDGAKYLDPTRHGVGRSALWSRASFSFRDGM
jgi:hypothetical protein